MRAESSWSAKQARPRPAAGDREAAASRLSTVLGAVVALLLAGCSDGEPGAGEASPPEAAEVRATPAARTEPTTLAETPEGLRAMIIHAMQREAGPAYDLELVRDGAGALDYEGELVAMARVLRVDAEGVAIARGYEGEAELSLQLERAGCAGEARALATAEPAAAENRASFLRALGDGRRVEEWYLSGPLGLEQGFTVAESWGCTGELELDVGLRGVRVESGRREGELALVSDVSGERFRYGELAAWDAEGKVLAARMERRDGGVRLVVDAAGAVFPVVVDPLLWVLTAKLVASDGAANDGFGWSVSLDGDTALVGVPLDDVGANLWQGSAYVFARSGSTWTEQAKLVASDGRPSDQFGSTVALSGGTALVGAPFHHVGASYHQGSAYVFVRNGNAWTQQAKIVSSDGAIDDRFGSSVALSGDTALVGAPWSDIGASSNQGSAYVFVRSGSSWSEQAKLTGGVGDVDDEFGGSVALSGDTALVGANRDDIAFTDQGSAHVFVRSGSTWSEQAKLEASDGAAYGWFGSSVALSGDTALIGASDGIRNEGSAYVFVRSGGTWAEQAKLPASGYGLALSGDTALVTSDERYVFVRSGTTWTEQATLALSDGASANGLSSAVALSGDTALVGAAFETIGANPEQGSVYVFTLGLGKGLGDPCEGAAECASGSCADGVCCDTPCGNSATNDCQACSIAAGAASNGFCGSTTTANTCDDGDACTLTDQCDESGTCAGATPRDCDDQNECTIDSCDASSGCAHAPAADGTACDGGECRGGVCDAVGVAQDSDAEGGCSCRIAGAPSGRGLPRELGWLALAGLVSAVGVRRRRPT